MENWAAGQKPLIVAGNEYSTPLNVLTNKGDLLWHPWEQVGSESKSRTGYMGFHLTAMVFLDADRDGRQDIVFGTRYNRVYAVDALSGAIKWTENVGDEAAALLRVDDAATGEAGVAVGTAGGDLVLLSARGARLGALAFGRPVADLKALAIAGKGRTDIAVLFSDGCAAVVDRDLKVRAFHSGALMEKPLALVCGQAENGVFKLNIVTSQRIVGLEYRPHFRRATRFY